MSAVRAELDWLHDIYQHDIYLRDTKRDRVDAADDRASSRTDRVAAGPYRNAADGDLSSPPSTRPNTTSATQQIGSTGPSRATNKIRRPSEESIRSMPYGTAFTASGIN